MNLLTVGNPSTFTSYKFKIRVHVHTALFKMDNEQRPAVKHRELWSMLCVSLDARGVQGIMDIYG